MGRLRSGNSTDRASGAKSLVAGKFGSIVVGFQRGGPGQARERLDQALFASMASSVYPFLLDDLRRTILRGLPFRAKADGTVIHKNAT